MTSPRTPPLQTKLPAVGTTIFTVMSALASETGAVNLGQGFPDFECDPKLVQSVTDAMTRGLNQYPPMTGVPALREAVAGKVEVFLDGGVRRGTDVLKALALGAKFVFVGRPFNYAAAVGAEAGVAHAIEILRGEVHRNMALLGINSLAELGPDRLTRLA